MGRGDEEEEYFTKRRVTKIIQEKENLLKKIAKILETAINKRTGNTYYYLQKRESYGKICVDKSREREEFSDYDKSCNSNETDGGKKCLYQESSEICIICDDDIRKRHSGRYHY